MGLSRRAFTRELKIAAIRRLETGSSIAEVARAFEVNPNVLIAGAVSSGKGRATPSRASESDAGMIQSKPSWSGRSASRPWRSIF